MPSDLALKTMNAVHRVILKVSGGRIGWHAMGMQALELTTIGRRSGESRSTMLTAPIRVGDSWVVVASRGGDDTHPAWFLNLREEPNVEVRMNGRERLPMIARIATADERAELWPQVTSKFRNYAGYQKRTRREIPLVLLEPIPASPPARSAESRPPESPPTVPLPAS